MHLATGCGLKCEAFVFVSPVCVPSMPSSTILWAIIYEQFLSTLWWYRVDAVDEPQTCWPKAATHKCHPVEQNGMAFLALPGQISLVIAITGIAVQAFLSANTCFTINRAKLQFTVKSS